jgi:hypothetical protein
MWDYRFRNYEYISIVLFIFLAATCFFHSTIFRLKYTLWKLIGLTTDPLWSYARNRMQRSLISQVHILIQQLKCSLIELICRAVLKVKTLVLADCALLRCYVTYKRYFKVTIRMSSEAWILLVPVVFKILKKYLLFVSLDREKHKGYQNIFLFASCRIWYKIKK